MNKYNTETYMITFEQRQRFEINRFWGVYRIEQRCVGQQGGSSSLHPVVRVDLISDGWQQFIFVHFCFDSWSLMFQVPVYLTGLLWMPGLADSMTSKVGQILKQRSIFIIQKLKKIQINYVVWTYQSTNFPWNYNVKRIEHHEQSNT